MKKNRFIYCLGLIGIIFNMFILPSCDKILDVNDNPNYPKETTMAALLPSACVSTVAQLGWNGSTIGTMWLQHTTQGNTTNQYNTLVNYNLSVSSYNTFFTNAYANTLPDLVEVIAKAENEKAWNYWIIGKILTAYNFHMLTDMYEDIPFTEAMDIKKYPHPNYDNSKTVVYPGILAILDAVIAKKADGLLETNPTIGKYDMFMNGDIEKWIGFARNLKLKVLMRDFETNKAAITALLNTGNFLEEDCAMTVFEDASNKGNPFYEYNIRQLNTKENIRACHTLCEFLLKYNDPRIENIYEMTGASKGDTSLPYESRYEGLPCGTKPPTATISLSNSSRYKQRFNDPVYLMNKAEILFLEAEAYARLQKTAEAKTKYEEAVKAAFDRWPESQGKGADFIAVGKPYEFNAANTESMLKSILVQKWVSYARANSLDGVFDRNRTGIPELSNVKTVRVSDKAKERTLTDGYTLGTFVDPGSTVLQPRQFPRRILVPVASSQYNPNAPKPKNLDEPMWWQVAKGE